MSSQLSKNLESISDPSDFKSTTIPALSELDVLERCYICKEFFRAPVITSCNHTFCSQCIREYLITNNLCPLCKTEVFESSLKRDVLLEEIVGCYTRLRPFLLMHLKNDHNSQEQLENTRKREIEENNDVIEISSTNISAIESQQQPKRQKLEQSPDVIEIPQEDLVECPVCSKKMTAERLQNTHIDACLNGTAEPISPRPTPKPKGKSSIASFFKTATISSSPPSSSASSKPAMVQTLPEELGHQNFYFNETSRKPVELKRLQKLDFASLTTVKLKDKLSNLHLPTSGTRQQLELRYNQFFVLYNSNLDSNHPVSERILRQNLHQWELSHSGFKKQTNAQFGVKNSSNSGRSITDKNFSVSEWMNEYKPEFKELIQIARDSIKKEKLEPQTESDNKNGTAEEVENCADLSNSNIDLSSSILFDSNDLVNNLNT
ncbi:RAD18 [Candida jiufengensis]|uniref:RAD18 n=1 Tax=Candida jiufengensis TaxID=497108 RepID=UPI0022258C4D|nr:RAD18 [Candida jiufengensis]KAI5956838.1 RAD18 [Candida jiufengensis]